MQLRAFLLSIAIVAFLAEPAFTQIDVPEKTRFDRYRPWLDRVLLGDAEVIVKARLAKSSRMPSGQTTDRVTVLETLKGQKRATRLILGARRDFRADPGVDKLIFLKPAPAKSLDRLIDFIDLPKTDGARRVSLVRSLLKARGKKREIERMKFVRDLSLERISSPSTWVRRVLVREVERLTKRRTDLFDGKALLALQKMAVRDLPLQEQRLHRDALTRIEEANAVGWTGRRLTFRSAAAKDAFLSDLAAFQRGGADKEREAFLTKTARTFGRRAAPLFLKAINDSSALVRTKAIFLLGETEASLAAADLEALALGDEKDSLRKAALVALRKIESPTSLAAAQALIRDPKVQEDALKLLGALGPGKPREALEAYRAVLEKTGSADSSLLVLTRRILSPAYRKELDLERAKRLSSYAP